VIALVLCAWVTAAAPVPEPEPEPSEAPKVAQVDLNTADLAELCTLPGIGPKKGEAILALRGRKPFTRITQLLQVKGIGPRTLDKLKPRLTLSPPLAPLRAPSPSPPLAPLLASSPSPSSSPSSVPELRR